jgi:anti-sigma factor RsiW
MNGKITSEMFHDPTRKLLDQYLDGALAAGERGAVEQALASDGRAAAMLAQLRGERAARAAALAGYLPTEAEARGHAEAFMELARSGAEAPAGRIRHWNWARRLTAVAAAAVLVIGAFAAGRITAPAAPRNGAEVATALPDRPYTVVYWNAMGEPLVRQFGNSADVDAFVMDLEARQGGEVASVTPSSLSAPDDGAALSQEGSF